MKLSYRNIENMDLLLKLKTHLSNLHVRIDPLLICICSEVKKYICEKTMLLSVNKVRANI